MLDAAMHFMMPDDWYNKLWTDTDEPEAPRVHLSALGTSGANKSKKTLAQAKADEVRSLCAQPLLKSTPPRIELPSSGARAGQFFRDDRVFLAALP